MLILVAETNGCETHARLILLRPTRRALFATRVNRFFPRIAKTQLGKALTCVITRFIEAFAWPTCIAFTSGILAFWTQSRARTGCRQLRGRLTEANCRKAIASFVLGWPT